jgi:hypothetical protein
MVHQGSLQSRQQSHNSQVDHQPPNEESDRQPPPPRRRSRGAGGLEHGQTFSRSEQVGVFAVEDDRTNSGLGGTDLPAWPVWSGRAKLRLSHDFEYTLHPRMRLGGSLALPTRQLHKPARHVWLSVPHSVLPCPSDRVLREFEKFGHLLTPHGDRIHTRSGTVYARPFAQAAHESRSPCPTC